MIPRFFALRKEAGESDGAGAPADESKPAKLDGLREIQKRLLSLEVELKGFKGSESESIRAIAKEEVKALTEEIAALKLTMTAPPAHTEERGIWDSLEDWLNGK